MAVAAVFLGILTGLVGAGLTLAFGGGLGLALLAYLGGGLAGFATALAAALMPRPAARYAQVRRA